MSRPRRHMNRAEVWSLNGGTRPLRYVPRHEAEAMTAGEHPTARRISRKHDPVYRVRLLAPERLKDGDPATITCSEMVANGLGQAFDVPVREDSEFDFVAKAMQKIAAWPEIGDDRAIRVGPLGVSRPVLASFVFALLLLFLPGQPANAATQKSTNHCGIERWPVKILADRDADQVRQRPLDATVHQLLQTPAPSRKALEAARDTRFAGEFFTYRVAARLVGYKRESDQDFHLVLRDGVTSETLVAEIPSPRCTHNPALRVTFQRLRDGIERHGKATAELRRVNVPLVFEGVFFFDYVHGQTGGAPNGVELHPLLAITDGLKGSDDEEQNAARPGITQRAQTTHTIRVFEVVVQ